MPVDRRAAQRQQRRKQRRTALLAILLLALVAGIGVAARHRRHGHPAASAAPIVKHPAKLAPPGPIPGYLLIADRGNNRMLLVNSSKHIFWTYPAPEGTPAMPFRFGDDTFFGPKVDRIISNQEDQHTI
ncbi:MAG: hypothetical protein QOI08_929, partial [Actinomycetota bacterium]|nr:hypothetical protein [Actinomycetota bacterium]